MAQRQSNPNISPEDLLSANHPTLIVYAVSISVIVLALLFILILVLLFKWRKRQHERAVEAEIATLLHRDHTSGQLAVAEKKSSRTVTADELPQALTAPPENARIAPFEALSHPHINSAEFVEDGSMPMSISMERQLHAEDHAERIIQSRITQNAAQNYFSPTRADNFYEQSDENAHRDVSIRVPPSPPLDPCEYEWELMHGGQAQPFPVSSEKMSGRDVSDRSLLASEIFHNLSGTGTKLAGPMLAFSDDGGHTPIMKSHSTRTLSCPTTTALTSGSKSAHALVNPGLLSPTLSMAQLMVLESPRGLRGKRGGSVEADLGRAHAWLSDDDWLYDGSGMVDGLGEDDAGDGSCCHDIFLEEHGFGERRSHKIGSIII